MIYLCTDISKFDEFLQDFRKTHEDKYFIDLSKLGPDRLADESDAIVSHQKDCIVFLGYLEPGWMLDPMSQTRMRTLFRKFPVALVTNYVESIPFSWKNEIDIVYTFK